MMDGSFLLIEQNKSLGKGGLCWDAAFVLGEYLIETYGNSWNNGDKKISILELGSGTGLCGLMVARAISRCHVIVTDLPNLMPLLQRNVARNFEGNDEKKNGDSPNSPPNVKASVLEWGDLDAEAASGTFDVILGADVVASLYDPVLLAQTIYRLSHDESIVYISFKERLSTVHRQFEDEMRRLFENVTVVPPVIQNDNGTTTLWRSRNRNPDIQILKACVKKA